MRSPLLFALLAGIVGVFIGRALPRDTSGAAALARASPPSSPDASSPTTAAPTRDGCRAERTELASIKAQLAICMAFVAPVRKTEPSSVAERSEQGAPELDPADPQRTPTAAEIRRNRELLDSYSEAVIVQHPDGTTGVYRPEKWPTDGDGVIVARKLPSGEIGWYAGPEAGPRSDPAAFRRLELSAVTPPTLARGSDGTLQVNGKPGGPALQRMFPGTPRSGAP